MWLQVTKVSGFCKDRVSMAHTYHILRKEGSGNYIGKWMEI